MHGSWFAYESPEAAQTGDKTLSERFVTLNGNWKFNWVRNADQRPTDFFRVGYNDKGWNDMPVPGLWELNGYGDPVYLNVGYAWRAGSKTIRRTFPSSRTTWVPTAVRSTSPRHGPAGRSSRISAR